MKRIARKKKDMFYGAVCRT